MSLQEAEAAYRKAASEAERARVARNAAILKALKAGYSLREIADVTGVSRTRIHQIGEQR
jgi:DNA-directed RNA polymerase sigma subunit (sigma70/sigma32)